ncbi:hypothetical protein GCM10011297_10820 [Bacterioplanes sanyensis]|uniref:motility associated factor glycosyltransferase family protein n=1 Tax=Bacterioplanes sanyensis TaxID=1249553 RepID=UPI0016766A1A|nr:6-hydroxymethylpterin diphosphokinase MptE-like protein [Bacterioplanes sanyensis]GGY39450.1 hypothetical protein GCM10011297_10820 [Bacterioplanes sanyensis]
MIETALRKAKAREQKNLQFFERQMPDVYRQLSTCELQPSLVIDPTTGRIGLPQSDSNVDLYGGRAPEYALEEVERFNQKVESQPYHNVNMPNYLPHLIQDRAFEPVISHLRQHRLKASEQRVSNLDLVVFGVGLGYHIEILANQKKYRSITVVEQDITRLKASLYCIDWQDILTSLSNGYFLSIITKSPGEKGAQIYTHDLRVQCVELFPSLSSSTIRYTHTPDSDKYQAEKKLLEEYSSFVGIAYEKVGPDTQRILNSLENSRRGIKILNMEASKITDGKPIAIVGAGPSLDIYIDALKKHRDNLFIITAGSGLSSLLASGIRPDAHLELEYQVLAADLLQHINEQYNLSDITLLTTIEGAPGFVELFNNVYAFIPESSPIATLYSDENILREGGINCANGALAVAARLTKADIYLFGIDYAFTNNEHHSSGNISQHKNLPKKLSSLRASTARHNLRVQSTQGDIIGTKSALNAARLVMEESTKTINNNIYNCSHGAAIEGTTYTSTTDIESKILKPEETQKSITYTSAKYEDTLIFIKSSFDNAFKISNALTEPLSNYSNKKEQIFRIFRILREIKDLCKDSPSIKHCTMGINRLPLLLLYNCLNILNEEDAQKANNLWLTEYKKYTKKIQRKIYKLIDGEKHLATEEWTSKNYF